MFEIDGTSEAFKRDHPDATDLFAAMRELAAPKPDTVADETGVEFFAVPEGLHPNTANLVARFATALAEKLAAAERKYGYSDNWARPDWMDECRQELVEHVAKGDPRDVAAYCAFLWHHGESTAGAKPDAVEGLVEKALDRMRHAPPQLWRADLIGQQISVERMRDILAFALDQARGKGVQS
jgi:hypothetical protein